MAQEMHVTSPSVAATLKAPISRSLPLFFHSSHFPLPSPLICTHRCAPAISPAQPVSPSASLIPFSFLSQTAAAPLLAHLQLLGSGLSTFPTQVAFPGGWPALEGNVPVPIILFTECSLNLRSRLVSLIIPGLSSVCFHR